jgi:hypothetical protein
MKHVFSLLIFSLLVTTIFAQAKGTELTHYLFPEFTKGVVLMKTGVKNEVLLNYNSLTEEMIFENKGIKLAVGQLEQIDTAYISGRKFIPWNNKFIELIYHSKFDLYAEHKCNVVDPGKPAGYGGSSQTSATTTYSTFFSGSQAYELKLPESYETKSFTFYWLKNEDGLNKFVSIRQLIKLFGEKEELLKKYVKKHDVKYDNQESIVGLIKYIEMNH